MIELIQDCTPVSMGFADWGTFGPQESPNYYLRGYATYYSNGIVVLAGGGGASGHDIMELTMLERDSETTWKIIGQWSETC